MIIWILCLIISLLCSLSICNHRGMSYGISICNHRGMSYGMGEVICSPLSGVELGTRGPAGSGVILDWEGVSKSNLTS